MDLCTNPTKLKELTTELEDITVFDKIFYRILNFWN